MSGFKALFWTAFFGAANDNFFKNALVMLITFKGMQVWGLDHKSVIALAGGIFILPYFLFSGIAGELSDRMERAQVFRLAKYWEMLIMAGATLCFFLETYDWLLVVLFCMGTQSAFFSPAKYSSILDLSSGKDFIKSNAYMELGTFLAILIGTIGGGIAASTNSYSVISAGILGMAAIGIFSSHKIPSMKILSPNLPKQWNPVPPSIRIIKDSFKSKDVFWSIMATSWFWFLGASILALIPVLAKDILHTDESVATALLACFTIGIGTGSLLCEKLSYGRVELALSPIGAIGASIFLIDLGFAASGNWVSSEGLLSFTSFFALPGSFRIGFDMMMISLFCGIFVVPLNAWLQVVAKPEYRSRVIACNNIINALAMVFSAVFIMLLHALEVSSLEMFIILGLMGIVMCLSLCLAYPKISLRFWAWTQARCLQKLLVLGKESSENEKSVLLCETKRQREIASVIAYNQFPSVIIYDRQLVRSKSLRKLFNMNSGQGIEDWDNLKEIKAILSTAKEENKKLICFFNKSENKESLKDFFLEQNYKVSVLDLSKTEKVKFSKFVPGLKVSKLEFEFNEA